MPTLAEKWIEEGKKEGLEEGLKQGLELGLEQGYQRGQELGQRQGIINSIIDLLRLRFDAAPDVITEQLSKIEETETLSLVLRQAATADSLQTFEQYLETL